MLSQIVFLIKNFFAIQHILSLWLFSVIKYRPQKIVLPACPGDLPACPPKRTKVKGKCAGVPSIYILQPDVIPAQKIRQFTLHCHPSFPRKLEMLSVTTFMEYQTKWRKIIHILLTKSPCLKQFRATPGTWLLVGSLQWHPRHTMYTHCMNCVWLDVPRSN